MRGLTWRLAIDHAEDIPCAGSPVIPLTPQRYGTESRFEDLHYSRNTGIDSLKATPSGAAAQDTYPASS